MRSERKLYSLRSAMCESGAAPEKDTQSSAILDSISACRLLYSSAVQSESSIILLRSRLLSVAQRLGFSEIQRENMALVASEMVSNQIKHAQLKGQMQIWQQPGPTLDILALDYGRGIPNLLDAQRDGFSTANTLGKGLGSIQRLADEAAIYSQASAGAHSKWTGTAVLARFRLAREARKKTPEPAAMGLFSRALSDDRYNGDRIYLKRDGEKWRWLHLDGLGHGENAQNTTADLASHLLDKDPETALASVDRHLHGTRGAVAVIGEIALAPRELQLLGVGDMHAAIYTRDALHKISFSPGILGKDHLAAKPFCEAFESSGVIITASDGIRRSWDENTFPGLFNQPPQLIAYVLGNIMARISDDQSLCVIKIN